MVRIHYEVVRGQVKEVKGQRYHVVIRCPGVRAFNYVHIVAKSKGAARRKAKKKVPDCEIVRVSRDYW